MRGQDAPGHARGGGTGAGPTERARDLTSAGTATAMTGRPSPARRGPRADARGRPASRITARRGRVRTLALTFMVQAVALFAGPLTMADMIPAARAAALPEHLMPPPAIAGARLVPLDFSDLDGWARDDLAAAFVTFRLGCSAAPVPPQAPAGAAMAAGLALACRAAEALGDGHPAPELARAFFETQFRPYRVLPEGRGEAFFTGYYEPEVEGALAPGPGFEVPVYGRPGDLVMAEADDGPARRQDGAELPPYYDRAQIEDGALAGRGLEIAYLKDPVDLFFMQIQGSGRVRLPDGRVLRLNYDGANGYPYTPVGRLLIQRGLVPRQEMSMERIRAFMRQQPEAGRALRRENRSYVFFKALDLPANQGPMGAQGVPLTAGRSLAVDRRLYSFGLPVFVEVALPLAGPRHLAPFHRLMIAQDTGSAIVGPARGDLYFGAGAKAAAVAGRIRHAGRFTLLVPRFTVRAPP